LGVGLLALGLAALGSTHLASAAIIWTDANGDGLPDGCS